MGAFDYTTNGGGGGGGNNACSLMHDSLEWTVKLIWVNS